MKSCSHADTAFSCCKIKFYLSIYLSINKPMTSWRFRVQITAVCLTILLCVSCRLFDCANGRPWSINVRAVGAVPLVEKPRLNLLTRDRVGTIWNRRPLWNLWMFSGLLLLSGDIHPNPGPPKLLARAYVGGTRVAWLHGCRFKPVPVPPVVPLRGLL